MIADSSTPSADSRARLSHRTVRAASLQENRRRRAHTFPPAYRSQTIEVAIKLGMNVVFIAGCVTALIHLLPQIRNQHQELQEIQAETTVTRTRVEHLQADFNRYFDPQEAKSVMQEQGHRVDPSQRRVVFVEPSPSPSAAASLPEAE